MTDTQLFITFCKIFFTPKNDTTMKLAVYYLDLLRERILSNQNDKFPSLNELKKELEMYL